MDLSKFTVKCQEALQSAQTKAINFNHQEVDGEHLLLVLLEQSDGLIPGLVQRMEVSVDVFRERFEQALDKMARISGPGTESVRTICWKASAAVVSSRKPPRIR